MDNDGLGGLIGLILIGLAIWFIGIPVGIFLLKLFAILIMAVKGG